MGCDHQYSQSVDTAFLILCDLNGYIYALWPMNDDRTFSGLLLPVLIMYSVPDCVMCSQVHSTLLLQLTCRSNFTSLTDVMLHRIYYTLFNFTSLTNVMHYTDNTKTDTYGRVHDYTLQCTEAFSIGTSRNPNS